MQMNSPMKEKRLTDIENRPVVVKGEEWGRMEWELGVS